MARVMLVDDEKMILRVGRTVLEHAGHSVLEATNGDEACQAARGTGPIDVFVVDHYIAPERGRMIASRLLNLHPRARVLHISGMLRDMVEEDGMLTPGSDFLQKPFRAQELREAVERLARPGTQPEA